MAFNIWKHSRTLYNRNIWKKLRNKVNYEIYKSKVRYCFSNLDPLIVPQNKIYKNLRKFGHLETDESFCDLSPECLNKYFVDSVKSDFSSNDIPTLFNELGSGFSFNNVSSFEVLNALNGIKSFAMGLDTISLRFINLILPQLLPLITFIFNEILTSIKYRKAWKNAKVIPFYKKSTTFDANNFRPISISPTLSKAFEAIMRIQITR